MPFFSPQGIISPKEDSNVKYQRSNSSISTLESSTFLQPVFSVLIRLKSCGCLCVPVVVCLSSPVLRLDGAELSSPKLNYTHLTHTCSSSSSTSKHLQRSVHLPVRCEPARPSIHFSSRVFSSLHPFSVSSRCKLLHHRLSVCPFYFFKPASELKAMCDNIKSLFV